jgi:AraC family transcriptional regulator
MIEEAKAGCPTGKIYSESLSAALAALVLSRYTADEKEQNQKKARLSAAQIQKVRDYVHAHMSNNIGLNELAGVLHLSAPNFARHFKNTMEITPYQYVLRERISKSIRLLSLGRISVSEVALATGFADQSHFSKIFKKCTTSTPRQYQLRQHHIQG